MFSELTTGRGRLSIGISAAIIMSMQDFVFPRTNTKPDGKQSKVVTTLTFPTQTRITTDTRKT